MEYSKMISARKRKYQNRIRNEDTMKFGIQEPVRRSMYDVILDNLDTAKMKTFMRRLFITGEHSFGVLDDGIITLFGESVKQANSDFHYEKVTGLLLCYSKHFLHMVEGDEDAIQCQMNCLFSHKLAHKLSRVKVLMDLTHIKHRLLPEWTNYYGLPARLLGEIKIDCSFEDLGRHMYNCIRKFCSFIEQYAQDYYDKAEGEGTEGTATPLNKSTSSNPSGFRMDIMRASTMGTTASLVAARDPYTLYLPETELLDFFLKNDHFLSVGDYFAVYRVLIHKTIYKDQVWPVPSDFIPYDIFPNKLYAITKLVNWQELEKESKQEPDQDFLRFSMMETGSIASTDDN